LPEHDLRDTVEQCRLVRYVPVEHRRIPAHLAAEAAHRQAVDTVAVDDPQRGLQDHRPADLTIASAGGRGGGVSSASGCIGHGRLLRHLG
jgi:hypothetical protein